MHEIYGKDFYAGNSKSQNDMAAPLVAALKHYIEPKSVIDIGCGVGRILAEWDADGDVDIVGVDGDYVDRNFLVLPPDKFIAHDLTKPLSISRRFDLAMCLEVAEHLEAVYEDQLISQLINLSDVIVFSAAIPWQGGNNHVNEHYQSYWASLFEKKGYCAIDCIRPMIWNDDRIFFCYRQNIIIYVNKRQLHNYPKLCEYQKNNAITIMNVIHPDVWGQTLIWVNMSYPWFAKDKIAKIRKAAGSRRLVCWGTGFNASSMHFFFSQHGFAPDMIFVDAHKEDSGVNYMPITPIKQIKNGAKHFYVIISPSTKHPEIVETLTELGYGEDDYCWFVEFPKI